MTPCEIKRQFDETVEESLKRAEQEGARPVSWHDDIDRTVDFLVVVLGLTKQALSEALGVLEQQAKRIEELEKRQVDFGLVMIGGEGSGGHER